MSRREKIMSLLPTSSKQCLPSSSKSTPERELPQTTTKLDYENAWNHHYVSLEDMDAVRPFEFDTSFRYHLSQNDLSKLKESVSSVPQSMQIEQENGFSTDLLCHESFIEDSDDSVRDKDYIPHQIDSSLSDVSQNESVNINRNKSEPKKKKRKTLSLLKINEQRMKQVQKHAIKEPCPNLCKKLCSLKILQHERENIHKHYWSLNWEHQGIYIKSLIETVECQRKNNQRERKKKRHVTYKYFFETDTKIEVCKTFFLTTLGFDKKNDRRIHNIMAKDVTNQKDNRDGRNLKVRTIDKELLTTHANSFNPCVHHYRRVHAPNRKYLPSDITITDMYKNFRETHPDVKLCFETYRNHITNVMNISFARLGHEQCEICEEYELHNPIHVKNERDPTCAVCNNYTVHKKKYTNARKMYDQDAKIQWDPSNICLSVDLQKVIMLPRMDTFKSSIFCPRLVAYNETFVPLGKFTPNNPVFAVVWHEGIMGRHQEDIVSAFRAFLLNKRDAKRVVIWLDNCSAQNKNWCLITFLISFINSSESGATQIVLKYFEPGHTFMSADSFHHLVEKSMDKKGKLYDFQDFVDAVTNANSGKVQVKVMEPSDFLNFKAFINQKKLNDLEGNRVYLKDIVEIMTMRGEFCMFYKTDYEASEYKRLNCLKSKNIPKASCSIPRGILLKRKQNIIKVLGPLMPVNRLKFWQELAVSDEQASVPDQDFFDTDQ